MQKKKRKKSVSIDKKMSRHGWVFVAPVVIGFIFFYAYILGKSFIFSFQDISAGESSFITSWVGIEHFKRALLVDVGFVRSLTDSVLTMLYNVPLIIVFSLFTATILNEKLPGSAFFRAVFFIPAVLVTGAIADSSIGNTLANSMQNITGVETGMISSQQGMFSVEDLQNILGSALAYNKIFEFLVSSINNIFNVVKLCGVQILLFIAGLQSLSPSIYEAAHIEGANGWDRYWKITFPLIIPIIYVNIIYSVIDSFVGASNPIMSLVYELGIGQSKIGYASALSWMYFAATLIFVLLVSLMWRIYSKNNYVGEY